MKRFFSYLTIALHVALASCSGENEQQEEFNVVEVQSLIKQYDANGGELTAEQYSVLIKNTRLLFDDIKGRMKDLLDIADYNRFMQEYQAFKQDKLFMEKIAIRDQVWRVLVLGQKGFSEENEMEFGNLPEECQLIDYYDDCIIMRLSEVTDSIAN